MLVWKLNLLVPSVLGVNAYYSHILKCITTTLLVSAFVYSATASSSPKKVYTVAEIDWCPQICPRDQNRIGYISEIVDKITSKLEMRFIRQEFPWSRGINYVATGKAIALSAPAKSETPNLIFPKFPIGIQKMCFFVLNDSKWNYSDNSSLNNIQIGLAKDTSIEELNTFVKNHPNNFQLQPYHERFIEQNVNKLIKRRIDTFIFTHNSTLFKLKKLKLNHLVREAGCVSDAPVYIAFTPDNEFKDVIKGLVMLFDNRMLELADSKELDDILKKYDTDFTSKELLNYYKAN